MYCTVLYRYESRLDQYNASIAVIWDRDNVMDSTNITLYKCGLVGSYRYHPDCSLCMTRYCTVLYCTVLSSPILSSSYSSSTSSPHRTEQQEVPTLTTK